MAFNVDKTKARLSALPDPIYSSRRFLVWRSTPVKGKKDRKIPYYADGYVRGGTKENPLPLDSPEDLARLVTLDKAIQAVDFLGMTGVGYAVTGEGIAAFDMDDCLTPEGDMNPAHAGADIVAQAEARGAYIEISPSNKGLRIFGPSDIHEAYSKDDLEYWGAGRYLTVTGNVWANPKGWTTIEDLRAPLKTPKERHQTPSEDDAPIISKRVLEELKSALTTMGADERELWVRMGHALKSVGDKGLELWLEWSATSDKFDEQDARAKWETFRPTQTNHRAVFAEAQKNWGWTNPRSGKPGKVEDEDDESTPATSILEFSMDLGKQKLYPTEFVLDGFLPTGVTLVAGAWGAGKSTNLIPLFASVAHLAPEAWDFRPQLRRHVIWITEAPDQARDTLYSLSHVDGSASWDDYKEWFHLVPARREAPKDLARSLEAALTALTYTSETELEGGQVKRYAVKPVIVLDTTSANMDLENESDNSEVGAAMSALKERLPGCPIVLVGHTPKALVKADVADMTFRGAGAWEADAVATFYLVYDPDTDFRFMAIRKSRFSPDYTEISFGQDGGREWVDTPWGEPQSKAFLHGVPCRSNGEERKAARKAKQEEKKSEEKERTLTERQSRILEALEKATADLIMVNKSRLRELVGGKAELLVEATSRLIEAELVIKVNPPPEVLETFGANPRYFSEILLPSNIDVSGFFDRARVAKVKNQ